LDLVLTIDRATRDAILAHARRDHPDEACGVVTEEFVEVVELYE
jgi:[CysO sulfur-carrier protein]-S-L-cysteine hydrolase